MRALLRKWLSAGGGFEGYLSCLGGLENIPPCMQYEDFERRHGIEIEYVFLGFPNVDVMMENPNMVQLKKNLSADFDEVFRSTTGVVELFQRRLKTHR